MYIGICLQPVFVFLFSSLSYFVPSPFPSLVQGYNLNKTLFQSSDGFLARLGCGVLFASPYVLLVFVFLLSFRNGFRPLISTGLSIQLFLVSPKLVGVIGRDSFTTGATPPSGCSLLRFGLRFTCSHAFRDNENFVA